MLPEGFWCDCESADVTNPFSGSNRVLGEREHPLVLPRPTGASATASERDLSLAESMCDLEPCGGLYCIREGLKPLRRPPSRLDATMVLLRDVVQVLTRSNLHVPPLRALATQQPGRSSAGDVSIKGYRPREAIAVTRHDAPTRRRKRSQRSVTSGTYLATQRSRVV